jgi:hypothetical protein
MLQCNRVSIHTKMNLGTILYSLRPPSARLNPCRALTGLRAISGYWWLVCWGELAPVPSDTAPTDNLYFWRVGLCARA